MPHLNFLQIQPCGSSEGAAGGSGESWWEDGKPAVPVHRECHKICFSHYLCARPSLLLQCAISGRAGYLCYRGLLDDCFYILLDLFSAWTSETASLVEGHAEVNAGDEETSADLSTGTHAPAFLSALCRTYEPVQKTVSAAMATATVRRMRAIPGWDRTEEEEELGLR